MSGMKIVVNFKLEGMPWPKTDVTHYHAQLGLPDKVRAIKAMVWPRNHALH